MSSETPPLHSRADDNSASVYGPVATTSAPGARPTHEDRAQRWLERLVGTWTMEATATSPNSDDPDITMRGIERVRMLGTQWAVLETDDTTGERDANQGAVTDGVSDGGANAGTHVNMMTLGYDASTSRFIGTFVSSMMPTLWVYSGALDAAGTTLTLETEGPSYTDEGTTTRYRDSIEFVSSDHRIMRSRYADATGDYVEFMVVHARRAGVAPR